MVKVKITRDCLIKGKHYSAGEIAEVIEKDADILVGIEKADQLTLLLNQIDNLS